MSEYVKVKAIRLPFPTYLVNALNVEDEWDVETHLKEKFGELWQDYIHNTNYFTITQTKNGNFYLDYVLNKSYEYGTFAYSWELTEEDKEKYKLLFDIAEINYNINDLRKVCYAYYNGVDEPNCYEINKPDFDNL